MWQGIQLNAGFIIKFNCFGTFTIEQTRKDKIMKNGLKFSLSKLGVDGFGGLGSTWWYVYN